MKDAEKRERELKELARLLRKGQGKAGQFQYSNIIESNPNFKIVQFWKKRK